jgi:hypothetical protein
MRDLLKTPDENLQKLFDQLDGRIIDEQLANQYQSLIEIEYNRLINNFDTFARRSAIDIFSFSSNQTLDKLRRLEQKYPWGIDTKTINILTKNMMSDFGVVSENGKSYYRSYVEFSKQGMIPEREIDFAVAKGYLEKGTAKEAKKLMKQKFEKAIDKEIVDRVNKDSRFFRKIKYAQIEGMNIEDAVKIRLKAEFEEKLRDNKFLFLINKNGDVMTFKVKTYSDLVARTRLGEAQVAGTLEAGLSKGVRYYKVTSHGTKTKTCMPFEGAVLTTNQNDTRFRPVNKSNTPLYHINCKHRIYPIFIHKGEYLE